MRRPASQQGQIPLLVMLFGSTLQLQARPASSRRQHSLTAPTGEHMHEKEQLIGEDW